MNQINERQTLPDRSRAVTITGMATLSQTGASLVQQGIAVVGVFFAATLHLSLAAMGATVSAMSLGMMTGMPFWGMAVDRLGPRGPLLAATVMMAALSASIALVHSYLLLLLDLFFLGGFLSAVASAGTKAVFSSFSAEKRGLPMGIRQTGVSGGAALAALLLPPLSYAYGVGSVFVGIAFMLLAVGGAFALLMRPDAGARPSPHASGRFSFAVIRPVLVPSAVGGLFASGPYIMLTFAIPYLHQVNGLTITEAGVILAFAEIGGVIMRVFSGFLSDRLKGRRVAVLTAIGLLSVLMAVVTTVLPASVPLVLLAAIWFVLGLGAIGWNGLYITWAGERVAHENSGAAMSFAGAAVFLGSAIYPPLVGWVIDTTHTFRLSWAMLAFFLLAGVLVLVRELLRSRPPGSEQAPTLEG